MNRKEAIKKWGEIVGEMEAKKSELDNLLSAAKQSYEQTINTLNDVGNKLNGVVSIESQANQKLQTIEQSRVNATQKEEEAKNKLDAISQIHSEIENKKSEIENLKSETAEFYQEQKGKYEALYKQIEEELKAGTTSVNLSKSFADKVQEYHNNSRFWSRCFVILLTVLILYYGVDSLLAFSAGQIKNLTEVYSHLVSRIPSLIFGIWLAIFFGNRRAESKKLEESYKHKEVLARSFVGYKQTLDALGDEDKALLKQHMSNLLAAISENSATFLNTEGDKHPIFEVFSSIFRKSKNNEAE